ncbi:MAG: TPM domain-containing protein [bacterium]|nr:TPM domain-containing protein [bacterium]
MKRYALALFFLVPSIIFGYTSPGKPIGFVNDFAGILRPETISSLNQKLEQFAKDTSNEISVVTISKLEDETIDTYAEKLFQEWGIGKEKGDNGLLLLISLEDREMRIEVGYGLEPLVTDIDSGRIIREILTPAFQSGDYDGGISKALDTITGLIGGEGMAPSQDFGSINNWSRLFPYAIFAFIYLTSILGRSKSWWAGGIIGGVLGVIFFSGIMFVGIYILIGLIFDFIVSRIYSKAVAGGGTPPWWIGGGGIGGGHSGGFGGFGGGMSGGGGASGRFRLFGGCADKAQVINI